MTGIRDLESLASQSGTDADALIKASTDKAVRTVTGQFSLAQVAGTYDILTASGGDVEVTVQAVYVKTGQGGLTSAQIVTDHTTPKSVTASTVAASLGKDVVVPITTSTFILPSGNKIRGTIVGTGTAGLIYVTCDYRPVTPGAVLS